MGFLEWLAAIKAGIELISIIKDVLIVVPGEGASARLRRYKAFNEAAKARKEREKSAKLQKH